MSGAGSSIAITLTGVDRASKTIDQVNARIAGMRAPADRAAKSIAKFGDVTGITALGKGMRSVSEHSLQAFLNVSRLSTALGGVAGATSIAGMAALTAQYARFGQNLAFTSMRARTSAADLLLWDNAARVAGSSAAAMESGVTTLNDSLVKASQGFASAEVVSVFAQLHVNLKNADGSVRSVAQALPELVAGLSAVRDPTVRAYDATVLFGGAGEDLLRVFGGGLPQFQHYLDMVRKFSEMSPKQIADATALAQQTALLGVAVDDLGRSIGGTLAPLITPLVADMAEWIKTNPKLAQELALTVAGIGSLVGALNGLRLAWFLVAGARTAAMAGSGAAIAGEAATASAGLSAAGVAGLGAGALLAGGAVAGGMRMPMLDDQGRVIGNWGGADESRNPAGAGVPSGFAPGAGAAWWQRHMPGWLGGSGQPAGDMSAAGQASSLIAGFEGYRSSAYWDVNHFRAGYGSDTTTNPVTGVVSPVTEATAGVSREAARADLQRRVAGEFMPAAARAIGVDAWRNLSPGEQAAITSVAYNYGSGRIPSSVIAAARTGDAKQIGMAIEGLRDANEGINAGRRDREAQIAMTPQAPDAPGIVAGLPSSQPVADPRAIGSDIGRMEAERGLAPGQSGYATDPAYTNKLAGIVAGLPSPDAPSLRLAGPRIAEPPAPGIGDGTGSGAAAADSKVTGEAMLKVMFANAPPGMRTSTDARGDLWGAPPKVEQFMPLSPGG